MTRDGPRIRLAIVDDEPALLTSLGNYLGREFAVNTFADPREAVSYLSAENAADVVLCDIMMPHLSGKAVFEAVVAHSPGLADRFVFMSGGVTRDELRSFIASLPNVLLDKPFEMAELATVIRQAQSRAALAAG
jgi:DNA-binding NtrC family response regulator